MVGRGRELAASIGEVGVWSFALQAHPAAEERRAVGELEIMGYRAVWIPESVGSKEVFSHASILLAGTEHMVVSTGIASIWARDPMAMANGARAMAEAHPGRFLLGVGVSHAPSAAVRGHEYSGPIGRMRRYLDEMEEARYEGPAPDGGVPMVLAALGPRMLELAAERADGAHSYFVPVEHTGGARERLGPDPLLAVEQTAVIETDADAARRIARGFASRYFDFPNYANNLRRLGWSEEDLSDGGSDRLIDAVVAWGDVSAVMTRVRAHLDAGADHVCLQLRAASDDDLCLDGYREVAAALS
jgi:probable F420-dependent oxidoreductase